MGYTYCACDYDYHLFRHCRGQLLECNEVAVKGEGGIRRHLVMVCIYRKIDLLRSPDRSDDQQRYLVRHEY